MNRLGDNPRCANQTAKKLGITPRQVRKIRQGNQYVIAKHPEDIIRKARA